MKNKSIVRFLWYHIKPFKWFYVLMLQAPIINSFFPFFYNYALKILIDRLSKTDFEISNIFFPILIFIVSEILCNITWRISNIGKLIAEPKVKCSILTKSYEYIQGHSYSFFQNNFSGLITSKIKSILDGYDTIWAELHYGLNEKACNIIICLLSIFFINVKLATWISIISIMFGVLGILLSQKMSILAYQEEESKHSIFGQISDKFTNIFTIFSFNSKKRELNLLNKQIKNDFIPKQVAIYKYNFSIQIIGGIVYLLLLSFILFYIVYLKRNDKITLGSIAFLLGITQTMFQKLWGFTMDLPDFLKEIGEMRNSLSILELPQENKDKINSKDLIIKDPTIEFKNITFNYNEENVVFNNLNLKIKAGEKIGIVGYSGAGKSTLINLLLRYYKLQSGEIFINNKNIEILKQDSIRENIAIIPQDTILFHRSILENIKYGSPLASEKMVIEACKKTNLHEFIMKLPNKYDTLVGERGSKLSGGQRQRIAIARAILKDSPIYILDEATASLDTETEKYIQSSLDNIFNNKKKTIIAIAHRLSTIKNMDRIIVLHEGKIVEEGTHESLIKSPKSIYTKLYNYQNIVF